MGADLVAVLPEALLFLGGMVTLVGGSFTPRARQRRMGIVAAAATVAGLVASLVAWEGDTRAVFSGTFTVDTSTGATRVIVTVSLLLILLIASGEVRDHPRESETYSLLLFGGAGALLLAGSTDLAVLVVAFLLSSIPLYGLVGIIARPESPEAALKTYLCGALFGILLMLGAVLLYGLAGRAGYSSLAAELTDAPSAAVAAGGVLVLMGLLFKAGGVPGHFWVPDATQGASVSAAAFLTTIPKIGAIVAITRLVAVLPGDLRWATVLGVLAVASMTIGNLAALAQDDVRRLLGWSTVSQVGYLLAAAAVTRISDQGQPALLFFLAGYALTNLAAFAVAAAAPDRRSLEDWAGFASTRPGLSAALVVALLGLVGTPPTAVFIGKLTTMGATWGAGLAWLAVAIALNSVVSLFYYLRWLRAALRPAAQLEEGSSTGGRGAPTAALVAAFATVAMGLTAGPVWLILA
ncbi:NADH-quinone oxidoreductase subunit N [Nocardioides aquaticus]|uniref:NADH-quinone oxidoreductase subunit N n=1 Tax=Nocardioides aquaticus TaxID=160826 RepID=A0ABX8EJW7_9ACTN|nr:NADH-quinone oxidoreductase subunit N [Nocardioides aquaticus]QVT79358.1 NADH-quinone oxidoreductase subunit N [Nocardioides aquaticus]